jgi:uncharacterized protein YfaS (alpha-2-macroglobulin family)
VSAFVEIQYENRVNLGTFSLLNLIRTIHYSPKSQIRSEQLKELLSLLPNHLELTTGQVWVKKEELFPELWVDNNRLTSFALLTLMECAPYNDFVPGLLRSLTTQTKTGHFGTTQNNISALLAIASYIDKLEPTDPNLTVETSLQNLNILSSSFQSFKDSPVEKTVPLAELPKESSKLLFDLSGKGQLWSTIRLSSATTEADLSADISTGLILSRSFTIVRPEPLGSGFDSFKRGQVVRVTITMLNTQERHNLVLEDRIPAGFEPINFVLKDADLTLLPMIKEDNRDIYNDLWYSYQQIWPDKISVYADYLPKGVYTFSYLARAATPGIYLTPGPIAEEMYSPETFGRGLGQKLIIE